MPKAIRIQQTGGPEVMQYVDVEVGPPGPGEAQVRHHAIGLNYIDVYFRTGLYPQPLPGGIGLEGAGVVTAVGEGVTHVKPGDRVAYSDRPPGSYAELRNMPARPLVRLPRGIDFETAAAMMLKGMTVQYLFRRTYKLHKGQTILFHAAAGGVGLIAMQWAKALGVTVIGTVGSEEKAALARRFGCDHTILYKRENIVERVREITGGAMVPVVYDSVGKDTFLNSLDCAAPFGLVVLYGAASGPAPAIEPELLNKKGCLFLTRPSVFPHNADPATFRANAVEVFQAIAAGHVQAAIGARFSLDEVAQAHRAAESRATTGAIVLHP